MANKDFLVKNGLNVTNGAFIANSLGLYFSTAVVNASGFFQDGVPVGGGTATSLNTGGASNAVVNTTMIRIANSGGSSNLQPTQLTIGTSVVNSSAVVLGSNLTLTATTLAVGNAQANVFANSVLVRVANTVGSANLQPTQLTIGSVIHNSSAMSVGGTIINSIAVNPGGSGVVLNTTAMAVAGIVVSSTGIDMGGALQINTTALAIGSSIVNSSAIAVSGIVINTTAMSFGGGLNLNISSLAVGGVVVNSSSIVQPATNTEIWAGSSATKLITPAGLSGASAPVSVGYTASLTLNLSTGLNFTIGALTGNLTLNNPSGMVPGYSGIITIPQDGNGNHLVYLGTYWKCAGGAPTASTAGNAIDALSYLVISSTQILCWYSRGHA